MPLFNTGWLTGGILLLAGIIAPTTAGRASGLTTFPPYTRPEQGWLRVQLLDLLAFVIVSVFTPFADQIGWIAAGLVVYVSGAAIYLWALRLFARAARAPDAIPSHSHLITQGIFQLNRNPIYTGQTLMLLGTGIAGASVLLIALAVGFALLADRLVRAEERLCAASFGDAYRAYAARVPRWFGWRNSR